jgi:mono/diheme cytochrome c family protein
MRRSFLKSAATIGLLALAVVLSGCSVTQRDPPLQVWDDMKHQPKFKAQSEMEESNVFPNRRVSRMPVEDTVARESLREDTPFNTGAENGMYVGKSPVPLTIDVLKHGQSKFNTYCSPCHDQSGMGKGIVPTRVPAWQPANLTEDRIVQYADGEIFDVISHGRNTMTPYSYFLSPEDRWAVIAYVRALQRAAHSKLEDVPAAERAALK